MGKTFGRKSYRLSLTGHNLEIMVRVKKLLEWHVHNENILRVQLQMNESGKKDTFFQK